ncbi:carboxylating nicotinate-nucleotide diphosphorylase [Caldanaerobius polysaccharolyticus]|uniref:carboxylating nicotinate-nucleotide diphosphorylase n=1 Tax=Caldanaerobius polysaccharolyticus TaxID=44256 RepID=UPI00047C762E|nr:carboxylating nicotinate-nucleotide diphosphorylase [Caldanaerobius polysaccharolyticus]
MLNWLVIDDLIQNALIEDIGFGDVTTDCLIPKDQISKGRFIAKEGGVLAGIDVAKRVFEILDQDIHFSKSHYDGDLLDKGDVIAEVQGHTAAILKGERVALNILQRMSGIATKTYRICRLVRDYDVKIVDTRKTLPGFRMLDKYAVMVGGGHNHRINLSDLVLIKDNHIKAVGGIKKAVMLAKEKAPFTVKIEVEVETLEQLEEAIEAGADIVMLDNMDVETMRKAVVIADKRVLLEASGNVSEDNVREVASTGVDIISIGSLTHSVNALDISLKLL